MFGHLGRRSPPRLNWSRSEIDPDALAEYDAFGPWLLAIKSAGEMPRRFRSAYPGLEGADYLVKIPRSIDRRDAYPGGDLYGAVLALDDDGFTFLTASEDSDGFVSRQVIWDDVAAVRTVNNLLHADFVLLLKEGDALTVTYNSSSADLMTRIVDFSRQHFIELDDFAYGANKEAEEFEDFFFNAMLAEERHGGRFMLPIHFEAPGRSCRDAQNRRRVTTGLLILLSGGELVVIDREAPTRRRFFAHNVYRRTYIGLKSIRSFRLQASSETAPGHFTMLELIIEQQRLGIPCFKVPERVIDILRRQGLPQL